MLSRRFVGYCAVGVVGVAFGVFCERLAAERIDGWGQPRYWLPDLVVGLALLTAALRPALRRSSGDAGVAASLVLAALSWYSGTVWTAAQFWHRAPLLHALLANPRVRVRSGPRRVVEAVAYPAALIEPTKLNGLIFAALATVGAVAAGLDFKSRPSRHAVGLTVVASCWAAALIIGVIPLPGPGADLALLTGYQFAVCGIAYSVSRGSTPVPVSQMTNLIVEAIELDAAGIGAVRDALRRTLRDPDLELGIWSPRAASYLDPDDRPVLVAPADAGRTAIRLDRGGQPVAIVVSHLAEIGNDALIDAVEAAGRLADTHAHLEMALRRQINELTDSRRRLVVSADAERSRLEAQLRDGPLKRLTVLHERLHAIGSGYGPGEAPEPLLQADRQLDLTIKDLGELARGLHPRELSVGIPKAVEALTERCPVPVELDVAVSERYPIEVESAVYFVIAEALANVVKHASATLVRIAVHHEHDRLEWSIADNGVGGADPRGGTGLLGLADRVATLGGSLTITSASSTGTVLRAGVPFALTAGQIGTVSIDHRGDAHGRR